MAAAIISTFLTAITSSISLFLYIRALEPIYGSVPTHHGLNEIALAAIFVSSFQPFQISQKFASSYATIVFALAPNAVYWVAVLTSRWKEATWGPISTHCASLLPIISALVINAGCRVPKTFIARLFVALVHSLAISRFSINLWDRIDVLKSLSESQIWLHLSMCFMALSIMSKPFIARKNASKRVIKSLAISFVQTRFFLLALAFTLWWLLHTNMYNRVLPHPFHATYTHPSYPMQILSSVQSTTGLIVVGEALAPPPGAHNSDYPVHSVRYLRAAHSLLGGVWRQSKAQFLNDSHKPWRDSRGQVLGDSIYGVFVLQEIARLVVNTRKEMLENALIIGLGAGTSATAFHRHKLDLTIIEIDPAVYEAATSFFGVPQLDPSHVFLEDARAWTANNAKKSDPTLYDIIVHDCFSGGGIPEQLYTIEFWNDLTHVMNPEGVVIVNFAGQIISSSSRMVLYTLDTVFRSCRAFHDVIGDLPVQVEKYETEFVNTVFVCTLSKEQLEFRVPVDEDFLGSPLRKHMFTTLYDREIDLSLLRDGEWKKEELLLTDSHNPLGALQTAEGSGHWKLMREVLSDVFWETY